MSVATYEDVKGLDPSTTLLIDVREPNELETTGSIPNSINIPLGQVEGVFQNLTDEKFEAIYQREKPKLNDDIVFSCKSGMRALKALKVAADMGFSNLRYYKGSWTEWAEKTHE
ncbi:PREDICTED: heat shock protein 67B2-like [Nicrophorus vespilloides]|uniref:Heat shock protein 67B2-like n=1 Tax=Nicrophorus vespilloides TaxID=110193 RepID=A0ABM1NFQ6_NICVS|nr:PREDICTED: heat shock protein 67B2-like [Nicrophorus vespilloides]